MIYLVLVLLFLGPVLRFGYQFGTLDHTILSLKGIADADSTSFVNDWFLVNSPQPHWLFDLFTQWGESLHLLREFYFVYWIVATTVYAWALILICRHLRIEKYAWVIAIIMLLEPVRLLGTGPLLGSWALPHFLGGSLALMSCAVWLLQKDRWLWILLPLTTLVHTQQGALLSLLLVGASVIQWRHRWLPIVLGFLNLVLVYLTAKMRGVTDEGDFFLKLCKDIIPGHCYAPKWPMEWLLPLAAFSIIAAFYGVVIWKNRKDSWAALVLVATLTTVVGTLMDYFDVEPFASIFRRLFMQRMAGFSLFFTIVSVVPMFLVLLQQKILRRLCQLLAVAILAILLTTDSSIFREEQPIVNAGQNAASIEKAGRLMQVLIPPGETITMDPRMVWVRLASRRAVIADTKAIPVQEKAFDEWAERYTALGNGNFLQIDIQKLVHAMKKYNSHYLILAKDDPKLPVITKEFRTIATFWGVYDLFVADDAALEKFH